MLHCRHDEKGGMPGHGAIRPFFKVQNLFIIKNIGVSFPSSSSGIRRRRQGLSGGAGRGKYGIFPPRHIPTNRVSEVQTVLMSYRISKTVTVALYQAYGLVINLKLMIVQL
jgi:hypothetical protein